MCAVLKIFFCYLIGTYRLPQFVNTVGQLLLYFFRVLTADSSLGLFVGGFIHCIFLQYPPPAGNKPSGHPPSAFAGEDVKGETENKVAVNIQAKMPVFFIWNRR